MIDRSDVLKAALSLRPDQLVMLRFATELAGIKKPSSAYFSLKAGCVVRSEDLLQVADSLK